MNIAQQLMTIYNITVHENKIYVAFMMPKAVGFLKREKWIINNFIF